MVGLIYFEFVVWAILAAIAAVLCCHSLWRNHSSILLLALSVLWLEQVLERSWWLAWRTLPRHGIDSAWMTTHPIVMVFPVLVIFAALIHIHTAADHRWSITFGTLVVVMAVSACVFVVIR